jgi:hypothetical protein
MKNTISVLAAISIIVISFGTAFAFGDAANSPNANATSIYAFQSEREGLRHNANQISSDVRDARVQLSERASRAKSAAAQVVNSAENAIDKVTSEEFRNDVTNRVEIGIEQAKTDYKNLKTESSSGFRGSMSRIKEGVASRMSDYKTRIKSRLNPIKYSAEGVIQNIGGSAGHAVDNLLGR